MADRPKVECAACCGTGEVTLAAELFAALQFVRRKGTVTAADLDDKLGAKNASPTAMNNRLEKLRRLGLVDRGRQGRRFVYWPAVRLGGRDG